MVCNNSSWCAEVTRQSFRCTADLVLIYIWESLKQERCYVPLMVSPYLTAHVSSLIYACDLSTAKIKQLKKEVMQRITMNKETSVSRDGEMGDGRGRDRVVWSSNTISRGRSDVRIVKQVCETQFVKKHESLGPRVKDHTISI